MNIRWNFVLRKAAALSVYASLFTVAALIIVAAWDKPAFQVVKPLLIAIPVLAVVILALFWAQDELNGK